MSWNLEHLQTMQQGRMRLSVIHELFITSYRMNILAISKLSSLQVCLITLHL
jgi:hypothetical protein